MKLSRTNIILLSLIGLFVVFIWISGATIDIFPSTEAATQKSNLKPIPSLTATPTPTPIAGVPKRIIIPKINVDAPIVEVGTDMQGTMLMPEGWTNVGWYAKGFRPGEYGNAVLAGHLDSTTGPATFWRLSELNEGDQIVVQDARGDTRTFIVIEKNSYEFDKAPLTDIFGTSSSQVLNLITCTGWFNQITHNYSHRLVITSQLVK